MKMIIGWSLLFLSMMVQADPFYEYWEVTDKMTESCEFIGYLRRYNWIISFNINPTYKASGVIVPPSGLGGGRNDTYRVTQCGNLNSEDSACDDGQSDKFSFERVAKNNPDTKCIHGIGTWALPENVETYNKIQYWVLIRHDDDGKEPFGVTVKLTNNNPARNPNCPNNTATTYYNMLCDLSNLTAVRGISEEFDTCTWNVSVRSKYACVVYANDTTVQTTEEGGKNGGHDDSHASGGTIFVVIVVVLVIVYVFVGCLYNSFKHGRTGMDACPHLASWKKLAAYTKAGCQVSCECLTCGRYNSSNRGITLIDA